MNLMQEAMITLLRSGLTGEKLPLPEGVDWAAVCKKLGRQSVTALAYQGAVNCGVSGEEPVMQRLFEYYYRSLLRSERQMQAVEGLFAAFEANGIPFLPLKGCNMKRLYPKPELRAMGDADILIHPEDHRRIIPVMEALGFRYRMENDHVFEWACDSLHVELHKSLVPVTDADYYAYYGTGWQLAVKGEGYRHDLSVEDAYLFLFTHFARHYRGSGIGCRHLVDLYVYRRAYPQMDGAYIQRELRRLRLEAFHANMLRLLEVWFEGRTEDEITALATAFIFSGGSWGSLEAAVLSEEVRAAQKTGAIRKTSAKALLHACFPPRQQMTYRYEAVRRNGWLLPVFWVVRWLDILFCRPQKVRRRLAVLRRVNDTQVQTRAAALRAVGLEFHDDGISGEI